MDVFNPATQRTYYFPCDAWLEKTKEQGMDGCKKVLLAGGFRAVHACTRTWSACMQFRGDRRHAEQYILVNKNAKTSKNGTASLGVRPTLVVGT